jgi:hypothetical protein
MQRGALRLIVALSLLVGSAAAQEVVVGDLNNPMGLLMAPDGTLWIVDSGFGGETEIQVPEPGSGQMIAGSIGMTSRVLTMAPDGTTTVRAHLPSVNVGFENTGGARLARLGTQVFATSGGWQPAFGPEPMPLMAAVVRVDGPEPRQVASTWTIEETTNPDGFLVDTNPYGIVGGSDGMLYVADAGANTLLRVDPRNGRVSVVAVFDGIPGPMPNPAREGAMEMDPVPTGVVQAPDGTFYVAFLPGFPFLPGSSQVVRVTRAGEITLLTDGLTMITDLQWGPDGHLYAVSFGQFTEQGPVPGSGSVTRVSVRGDLEVVVEGLVFPTAIAFAANGDAYVATNGVGAPGSGEVLRYAGLGAR